MLRSDRRPPIGVEAAKPTANTRRDAKIEKVRISSMIEMKAESENEGDCG